MESEDTRRRFLRTSMALGAGLIAGGCATTGKGAGSGALGEGEAREQEGAHEEGEGMEEEVAPGEDLMREHGVLKRVLLVYGEAIRRLEAKADLDPSTVADGAKIIRTFIEDYHEKLEEDHLFPRFRKANVEVKLVDVLTAQHQAGRRVTDITMQFATHKGIQNPDDRRRLVNSMRAFIRMYEPHEAREDTVLFPALRKIVSAHEYGAMGEEFEEIEHRTFGEAGFEEMVERVAGIEKKLGIYELAQFTPGMDA